MLSLKNAVEGQEYTVCEIQSDDDELNEFLFRLGCYSGESVTVVSRKKSSCVIAVKDGRYNIDNQLAEVILVK